MSISLNIFLEQKYSPFQLTIVLPMRVLANLKIRNNRLQDHPHCGVVCRPHRTVRTAPPLMGQKCAHSHNFRTVHLSPNFEKMLEKKFEFSPSKIKK